MEKKYLCKTCNAELKTLVKKNEQVLYFSCDNCACINKKYDWNALNNKK